MNSRKRKRKGFRRKFRETLREPIDKTIRMFSRTCYCRPDTIIDDNNFLEYCVVLKFIPDGFWATKKTRKEIAEQLVQTRPLIEINSLPLYLIAFKFKLQNDVLFIIISGKAPCFKTKPDNFGDGSVSKRERAFRDTLSVF